ncbi:hypothetical protein [Pseudomonas denitrificans (nom. rej.)]|uniref:Uncharacterized protein n=1 Tax=Pseudomonas denitrificans TaxID=43306 RepID=A0A9X7N5L4_PSEDE|nr:hypothetical protein [Pseudomonas denitrificans (nom. rej.)]QEY75131.1 hypothetical protein F1C79_27835 [Pseudomonas denitrificans (nom. rej.)]
MNTCVTPARSSTQGIRPGRPEQGLRFQKCVEDGDCPFARQQKARLEPGSSFATAGTVAWTAIACKEGEKMSHPENNPAPEQVQGLRSDLEITEAVLSALDSETESPAEPRAAVEIANELLECMEAELLHIAELRAILFAVWRDPEATAHIKHITGAGIDASHFVSKGLETLSLIFKEELAALEQPDLAGIDGGEA